ncbi:hypothetical protein ACJX0J_016111, partial [Zea mays]
KLKNDVFKLKKKIHEFHMTCARFLRSSKVNENNKSHKLFLQYHFPGTIILGMWKSKNNLKKSIKPVLFMPLSNLILIQTKIPISLQAQQLAV